MKISTLAAIGLVALTAPALAQQASAPLMDKAGKEVGKATFMQTESGLTHVTIEATGLPPGPHGFHVHETGACDAATGFESAGGHFTGGKQHGAHAASGPHPGDFPNLHVATDGTLKVEFFNETLKLETLMDGDGSAVVIHEKADDYTTQPTGDAGGRLVCGVVGQAT